MEKKTRAKSLKAGKISVEEEMSEKVEELSFSGLKNEMIKLRRRLITTPEAALDIVSDGNSALLFAALDGLIDEEVDVFSVIILTSKLICSYPVVARFAINYFTRRGFPLKNVSMTTSNFNEGWLEEPCSKKQKKSKQVIIQNGNNKTIVDVAVVSEVLKALLVLLKKLPMHIFSSWDVKKFGQFNETDFGVDIRWYAYQCSTIVLQMSETECKLWRNKWNISIQENQNYSLKFQCEMESLADAFKINYSTDNATSSKGIHRIDKLFVSVDGSIVKQKERSDAMSSEVVNFDSFSERVQDIILHISNNSPVCLIGPIGSGKSTTLRQVISIYGRFDYPDLINVQMNDQIDSRVILGSYHSTDLPGQFVWKPGCLTRAILKGHWIVFEDIDAAPTDVITLLDGFVDSKTLSVPGYGEIDFIHPDFRMFATCRTLESNQSWVQNKIGKFWKKIFVHHYAIEDIKVIVQNRFPHLSSIVDMLLKTYVALTESLDSSKFTYGVRQLSIRDFFKFCKRVSPELDFSAASSAISLFQNWLDLFVASQSSADLKLAKAEIIGTHLNLLTAKSEYYLTMYTPAVSVCSRTNAFACGRFTLHIDNSSASMIQRYDADVYSLTKKTSNILESVVGCIKYKEPVLLVGETGVGKTSCVQHLAKLLNQKLIVVNLNRQSDSVDLLGGYKPIELKYIFMPLREEFEYLFGITFNAKSNSKYLNHIMTCFANKRWKDLLKLMMHVKLSAVDRSQKLGNEISDRWMALYRKLSRVESQLSDGEESPFAFSFIDGTLIKAIKNGYWILLDEINLATSEMLQCLSGVLDEHAQIHLWEKGDDRPVVRHDNFHLFAAMNPSTDVGKKDLPIGIRNRFSELYVSELSDLDELQILVADYLKELCLSSSQISKIVEFYIKIRGLASTTLVDGLGKRPHYSLRTLCRALKISSMNLFGSVIRSLYESFCLSFLTQLDFDSHPIVQELVAEHIFGKVNIKPIINQPIPSPANSKCVRIEGYWIPQGDLELKAPSKYILTSSIRRNLGDIARIVSAGKLPILIQGATSVGKTSLVQYLADCTGNRCYRINNHQHTDLQEYIGSYQSDKNGKLVFAEGVLVQAMRKGEWIILDELNLAPSEVLEALNRLLDDNRQLFITETGVTVTAHSRFVLFATQNPPGLYGGRKVLSRAFRNRFVELHFDEIPSLELENILQLRCSIPASYCKKIIGVMKDLQLRRKASAALQGKHGFATLRDLFRWAERYRLCDNQKTKFYDWDQHLADEGYLVLAGKERKESESEVIRDVLAQRFKRIVDPKNLFDLHENTSAVTRDVLELVIKCDLPEFKHIVWTSQMRRLAVLIGSSMKFKEPILLVGETGCGKTTIVQLLSQLLKRPLYCVNCHMNSEGSDFLGGLRPVRDHSQNGGRLFEWVDGPLVGAMEVGGIFLADEISLADDSVLERLNSVLEPERTLLIAEKGEENPTVVTANEHFHFVGTMNPGGDYGKKELSPALRNRLTEIWCDSSTNEEDLVAIIEHNILSSLKFSNVGQILVQFIKWLQNNELGQKCVVSIRDYLTWVTFINELMKDPPFSPNSNSLADAIVHGCCMTFLDGLGAGNTGNENTLMSQQLRQNAMEYLKGLLSYFIKSGYEDVFSTCSVSSSSDSNRISFGPFHVTRNPFSNRSNENENVFSIDAPTTAINAMRLVRAMQLMKPILLEGSPGVGKTALVSALAILSGHELIRINLSEQTDISDLFGADLPVEGKEGGYFEWRDGPLLQALKSHSWILLDELNLASQSVLEGLNACLDHRGSIYVPELNRTFTVSSDESIIHSKIFGCQNPVRQGGARKGLPKSFLNRFTQVYVNSLTLEDFNFVLQKSIPVLPLHISKLMSTFASSLYESVCEQNKFGGKGSPWDINLRDLMRWANLTVNNRTSESFNYVANFHPEKYVDLIYGMRMRTKEDRRKVLELFCTIYESLFPNLHINIESIFLGKSEVVLRNDLVACGNSRVIRTSCSGAVINDNQKSVIVLQKCMAQLEAIMTCLNYGWMPILVGPSNSGKTSLVKLVAELCGRKLEVLHPSSEMDTIELLGGFEQADIYRRVYDVRKQIQEVLQLYVKNSVLSDDVDEALMDVWYSVKLLPKLSPEEELAHDEEVKRIQTQVDFLHTAYLKCKSFSESKSFNPSVPFLYENKEDSPLPIEPKGLQRMERISKELQQIYAHLKAGIQTGAFQWTDSKLIKAMEMGEWLLIDGSNRCSSAVLDRLNSLMEPNGSIFLSERGSIDGNILEIKPHVEFRLILTVDPIHGEISRAMRNRGVEIYMGCENEEEQKTLSQTNDSEDQTTVGKALNLNPETTRILTLPSGINFFDLDNLLRATGLRDSILREAIINMHLELWGNVDLSRDSTESCAMKIVSSTKDIVLQLQQGINLREACIRTLRSIYMVNRQEAYSNIEKTVKSLMEIIRDHQFSSSQSGNCFPLLPVVLGNFVNSDLYRVWKHLETFEAGMGQLGFMMNTNCNIKLSKELLENFLILSVFSRVIKQDAIVVSKALVLRCPLKASFIEKLGTILESFKFEVSLTDWGLQLWDIQENADVIAKFKETPMIRHLLTTLKISLKMLYQADVFHQKSIENPSKRSLGYVLRNLKFSNSGPLYDFLQAFWRLAFHFNFTYETCLSEGVYILDSSPEGSCDLPNMSTLWLDGVKAALWGQRLNNLCSELCISNLPDEKLLAKMNLIIQWIAEQVLPTMKNLKAESAHREMQTLVENCVKTVSHCRDPMLLRQNRLFREACSPKSLPSSLNTKLAGELMHVVNMVWSYGDVVPPARLIKFFSANESCKAFETLRSLTIATFTMPLTEDDERQIIQIRSQFDNLQKSVTDTARDIPSESVYALQELLYLNRWETTARSSSFTNPILDAARNSKIAIGRHITDFLVWADVERFRHLYVDAPIHNIAQSFLLPTFSSRILMDREKMKFRAPTLENDGAVRISQQKLQSILCTELTESREQSLPQFKYRNAVENYKNTLLEWKTLFEDFGTLAESFEKWLKQLNELSLMDVGSKIARSLGFIKLGAVMVQASSCLMELSSYLPAVDPVVEKQVLAKNLEEQIIFLESWVISKRIHQLASQGRDIFNYHCDSEQMHPYIKEVMLNIAVDRQRSTEAKGGVIFRPTPPMYTSILQDMQQFVASFGSVKKSNEFTSTVHQTLHNLGQVDKAAIQILTVQCENWLDCHRNFVSKVFQQFLYLDITAAFLNASVHCATGYQYIADNLCRLCRHSSEFDGFVNFMRYPQPYNEANLSISGIYQEKWAYQKAKKSCLLSSIASFKHKSELKQHITKTEFIVLHKYCCEFSEWWKVQEEEKLRKQNEEAAFYVYKGKEKTMELSDDEQEEFDIANTFPSFDKDYSDLYELHNLEDGWNPHEPKENCILEYGDLSLKDVDLFYSVVEYATSLVSNRWLVAVNNTNNIQVDLTSSFVQRFEIGCFTCLEGSNSIDYEVEREFIAAASVVNHRRTLEYQNGNWDPSTYNFYYDPNISEIKKIPSLFLSMKTRINELLHEWPDHPALQQIMRIIHRIESFTIDSPVMKFLTGLELLLGTCQEWEGLASKRVSIAPHLEEITNLIISWRKMELRFWKNLLVQENKKQQDEAKTWWFHLFSTFMELLADKSDLKKLQPTLLNLLQKFIESSTIGQFSTRLILLKTLHRYLIMMNEFQILNVDSSIQSILWNIIQYYAMFQGSVLGKLNSLRAPIEKKLKEFMKISRWNDANFYALIDSVKKSQKTINKLVTEFKRALSTPVSSCLVADIESNDEKRLKYKYGTLDLKLYIRQNVESIIPTEKAIYQICNTQSTRKRFKRLPKILSKVEEISVSVLARDEAVCRHSASELNELTEAVIEKVHELQNQPIPDSGPHRKKILHNCHNLRRTNLADLFKTLQALGLSYKKGLIKIQSLPVDNSVPYDFQTKPVDVKAGWKIFSPIKKNSADIQLIKAWESCDEYFQSSIARLTAMLKSFQTPSKELGVIINERCKGFAVEMFLVTCDQRNEIEKAASSLWDIKALLDLDTLNWNTHFMESWKARVSASIYELEYESMQYLPIFEALSDAPANIKNSLLIETQTLLSKISTLKQKLSINICYVYVPLEIHVPVDQEFLDNCRISIEEICSIFYKIMAVLTPCSILYEKLAHGSLLADGTREIILNYCFGVKSSGAEDFTPLKFKISANKLLQAVLLSYQSLEKLTIGLSLEKISESMASQTLNCMQFPIIHAEFTKMHSVLSKAIKKQRNCDSMIEIYNSLKPLVQQFALTLQFYFKSTLEYHRECCKLLYVISGVFGALAQKGFCLPSDYEEEAMEEGAELDAKSGMGLGEGDTTSNAKDVSDKLESEDQLDDTLKSGESAKPADEELNDDDKGVEMSEDFGGKQQDKQPSNQEKNESDEEDSDQDVELDKQMGDVDGDDQDKLDEQMWGGSSDEDDDDDNNKEDNEGKGVPQGEESELAPKDSKLEKSEPKMNPKDKEQQTKDHKEMDDGEVNDDQVDPFHGQNTAEEEPEAMELPENLKLDGDEIDDYDNSEKQEENPFDLDTKETQDFQDVEMPDEKPLDEEGEKEIPDKGEEADDDMSTNTPQFENLIDEESTENMDVEPQSQVPDEIMDVEEEDENAQKEGDDAVEQDSEPQDTEDVAQESHGKDQDANSNTMNKDISASEKEQDSSLMKSLEEEQTGNEDKISIGQVSSEDGHGQEGQSVNKDDSKRTKGEEDKNASRKPGETDNDRSLSSETTKSRLNTMKDDNAVKPEGCENDEAAENEADLYQHMKDSEKHDALTIDNATVDQMNQRKEQLNQEEREELPKMENSDKVGEEQDEVEDIEESHLESSPPDLIKGLVNDKKRKKKRETWTNDEDPDKVEIPGDRIRTLGAQRPADSTIHTQLNLFAGSAPQQYHQSHEAAIQKDNQIGDVSLMSEWHELERKTTPLSQELCEQLRLILEPTQAAKLKGDYKTGKRLNMRKVIPYIASGFRKDKIWLRRTQPSKREYQVLLALDDSASMCDNQSKQMAFSAVAVVAKALSLLEVGQLAVASFGEDVQLLHSFDDPFSDSTGARLMQKFTFAQRKTRIVQLMETTTALFNNSRQSFGNSSAPIETAQLLLIISDGRAVCHEGSEIVKNAVRKAMDSNVFIVFVIVDNPENKHSILDIQKPIFKEGQSVQFIKYMDEFPFPFYLILRDLTALPSVLSDALRQWFELVTSSSR